MEIAAGSEVYLNVSVTGYPPPQLFWFKDGSPLNMDLAGVATDKLMHGQAIYSCIARNIAGEATTSATVFATKESVYRGKCDSICCIVQMFEMSKTCNCIIPDLTCKMKQIDSH